MEYTVKIFKNDRDETFLGSALDTNNLGRAKTLARNLNAIFAGHGLNWVAQCFDEAGEPA